MSNVIDEDKLKQIVEGALMAADEPLSLDQLSRLFAHGELDSAEGRAQIRDTLKVLEAEAEGRGYELKRVASGFRYQVRQELSEWISRLWEEKPPRYSRALLETLALIAYRQPVTRGDIEQVRGVSVSQNIMRTLLERGWIRAVGQREVPGRPSLYGTTRAFLDYFDLKSLDELPPLSEIQSLIEPLVIEEVIEEAREVAERDHPELAEAGSADPAATAEQESAGDAGSEETENQADQAANASDNVADAEREDPVSKEDRVSEEDPVSEEDSERETVSDEDAHAQSAEVVRLPTTPRR